MSNEVGHALKKEGRIESHWANKLLFVAPFIMGGFTKNIKQEITDPLLHVKEVWNICN